MLSSNSTTSPPAVRQPLLRSAHAALLAVVALCAIVTDDGVRAQGLGPPIVPFENLITPEKAVLGKILFWDEQLSSDDTVACGTCHRPAHGGADPRVARHPGFDGVFMTDDDVLGSPGIVSSTAGGSFDPHAAFGLNVQATRRTTPTNIGAPWQSILRWDGLAIETFIDPQTRNVLMWADGALENHTLGPPTDAAEMAYPQRSWDDIATKLGGVRPLALATALPPDVAAELSSNPDYGELVRRAFGDRTITATRLIYAIATYQRTLVPDQSPWDRFVAGNTNALTANQQAGLALFEGAAGCARCHTPPLFTDGSFRNLGIRPWWEDRGWQIATLDPTDRGKFKVPTARNAGLRPRFMHNGRFATLADVIDLYDQGGGPFTDNRDPILAPLGLTATEKAQLEDFVANGLTDPRVANEQPPFDRPTLWSERRPSPYGVGLAGSGNRVPRTLHDAPAAVGSTSFRIGVADALGGAPAFVLFAGGPGAPGQQLGPLPIHLALSPPPIVQALTLSGSGPGNGHGTLQLPIPSDPGLAGVPLFHQAFVVDPGAAGGLATTAGFGTMIL